MIAPSILCVHQGYELYGSDRTFIQSVRSLREHFPQANITVYLPKAGPLTDHLAPFANDITIVPMSVIRKRDLKELGLTFFLHLMHHIQTAAKEVSRFDLVYINSIVVLDYLAATRFSTKPAILHIHEIPTGAARLLFSGLARLCQANLLFNSEATRNAFDLPPNRKVRVIHNGVARPSGSLLPLPKSPKLHVLLIGRFNSWKGQDLLLRALGELSPEERSNLEVRIVGDVFEDQTHYKSAIFALRHDLDLENCVAIEGFTAEPRRHYEWAHCVVVPSTQPEPFGLVAAEAMANGRAVIAAGHGGLAEIVIDKVTGRLFQPGDANALANILRSYLSDRNLIARHSTAGHQRYLEAFQEEHYIRRIGEMVAGLLEKGNG